MSLIATAPASRARVATWAWNVSALIGTSTRSTSPSIAGISLAASSSAPTGFPARAATAPTSKRSNPASTSRTPSSAARSGVPLRAPSKNESTVTFTIPAASGGGNSSTRSARRPEVTGPTLGDHRSAPYTVRGRVASLCVHRPRRDPSGPPRLALSRLGGQLLDAPSPDAGGLPSGGRRGRDHVRPPRGPGDGRRAATGPDVLYLRGRLRCLHRRRADAADRRLGPRRSRHAGGEDARGGHPRPALRALCRPPRVAPPLAPRSPPVTPLPRQGRRGRGQPRARRSRTR